MFNLFKSSKEKSLNFLKYLATKDIQLVAIELLPTSLKCQWDFHSSKLAVELHDSKVIFTDQNSRSFSLSTPEINEEIRHIIKSTLLEQFEKAKSEIHNSPDISTPQEGELKGQEWVKVTNTLLTNSYQKAVKENDLYIDAKIFIGRRSAKEDFSIRFQSFNLDYSYQFMPNSKIFMNVYDDKNHERGSAKEASYSGEFYNNRPQILDQILTLISDCMKASHFRIFS